MPVQTVDCRAAEPVLPVTVARINGVALNKAAEYVAPEELRQRACTELLRQAAIEAALLDADDVVSDDGVISEAAANAIEALLGQNLPLPEASEEVCRRYHAAHAGAYRSGERVRVRHILFAVTPGLNLAALRQRAEACLLDVRCHDRQTSSNATDRFADSARELSNCPSGELGGELGWLSANDCAPEFAHELFGHVEVGVLSRLVHSRFGLHVVEVQERDPGVIQPFEAVRGTVANALRQQAFVTALRQYLRLLAAAAMVEGIALEVADTPLLQ